MASYKSRRANIPEVHRTEVRDRLTASRLVARPPQAVMSWHAGIRSRDLDLFAGESNLIGEVIPMGGKTVAAIANLYVCRRMRGHGIGSILLKGFIAEARAMGAEELWSDHVSNQALGLRAKLMGVSVLHFYDADTPDAGFLPLTFEQARQVNNRVRTLETSDPDRFIGNIGVYVNFADIPGIDEWQRPPVEAIELTVALGQ